MNNLLINQSKKYEKDIFDTLCGKSISKENHKELIVTGFLSLSLDHHNAIVLLLEKGIYSSSFTLLRPLIDSVYRGLWSSQIATENEINEIFDTKYKFKNTYKLIKDIDEKNNTNTFYNRYNQVESFLHGMTHGGIEQLIRQFSKNGDFVEPTFSKKDLLNLVNHINAYIAIFLIDYNKYHTDDRLKNIAYDMLGI